MSRGVRDSMAETASKRVQLRTLGELKWKIPPQQELGSSEQYNAKRVKRTEKTVEKTPKRVVDNGSEDFEEFLRTCKTIWSEFVAIPQDEDTLVDVESVRFLTETSFVEEYLMKCNVDFTTNLNKLKKERDVGFDYVVLLFASVFVFRMSNNVTTTIIETYEGSFIEYMLKDEGRNELFLLIVDRLIEIFITEIQSELLNYSTKNQILSLIIKFFNCLFNIPNYQFNREICDKLQFNKRKIVSISLWKYISQERRNERFNRDPISDALYKRLDKTKHKQNTEFIIVMIDKLILEVNNQSSILLCEYILEFLITLENQLYTRCFIHILLLDKLIVPILRHSKLYNIGKESFNYKNNFKNDLNNISELEIYVNDLNDNSNKKLIGIEFYNLLNNLIETITFNVSTNLTNLSINSDIIIPKSLLEYLMNKEIKKFQDNIFDLYKDYKNEKDDPELLNTLSITSTSFFIDKQNFIESFKELSLSTIELLSNKINIFSNMDNQDEDMKKTILIDSIYFELIEIYMISSLDLKLKTLPLYPTEIDLFYNDYNQKANSNQNSIKPTTLPILTGDYLSFKDYSIRNFKLLQLDVLSDIKNDIIKSIISLSPKFNKENSKTIFSNFKSQMARKLTKFELSKTNKSNILAIIPPALLNKNEKNNQLSLKLSSTLNVNNKTTAMIEIDLYGLPENIISEWDDIKSKDTLFLSYININEEKSGWEEYLLNSLKTLNFNNLNKKRKLNINKNDDENENENEIEINDFSSIDNLLNINDISDDKVNDLEEDEKQEDKNKDSKQENSKVNNDRNLSLEFIKKYGIKLIRGCEVVQLYNDDKEPVNNFKNARMTSSYIDKYGKLQNIEPTIKTNKRLLKISFDTNQYLKDYIELGNNKLEELYSNFNIIIKRKSNENVFKNILENIRYLSNVGDNNIPKWIIDKFITPSRYFGSNDLDDIKSSFNKDEEEEEKLEEEENNDNNEEDEINIDNIQHCEIKSSMGELIKLKENQSNAIKEIVKITNDNKDQANLILLSGKKGSGKSTTIASLIEYLLSNHLNERILIVSHSNSSLDLLLNKISSCYKKELVPDINTKEMKSHLVPIIHPTEILRLGYSGINDINISDISKLDESWSIAGRLDYIKKYKDNLLLQARWIASCLGADPIELAKISILSKMKKDNDNQDEEENLNLDNINIEGTNPITGFIDCKHAVYYYNRIIKPLWNRYLIGLNELLKDDNKLNNKELVNYIKINYPFWNTISDEDYKKKLYELNNEYLNKGGYSNDKELKFILDSLNYQFEKIIQDIFIRINSFVGLDCFNLSKHKQINYLLSNVSKIIAVTCTYTMINLNQFINSKFNCSTIILEDSNLMTDIESIIPLITNQNEIKLNYNKNNNKKLIKCLMDKGYKNNIEEDEEVEEEEEKDNSSNLKLIIAIGSEESINKRNKIKDTQISFYNNPNNRIRPIIYNCNLNNQNKLNISLFERLYFNNEINKNNGYYKNKYINHHINI